MKRHEIILQKILRSENYESLDRKTFLKVWRTIFFLHPHLHPDEYRNPYGGWPKELKPLAKEAFRRAKTGELDASELYPCLNALKGIKAGKY